MKKIIFFANELGYEYKYPHHFDISLFLKIRYANCICLILAKDSKYLRLCKEEYFFDLHIWSGKSSLNYFIKSVRYTRQADVIVASTPLTLMLFFLKRKKSRFIYLPFELFVLTDNLLEKSKLQCVLHFICVETFQTSKLRARVFNRIFRPNIPANNFPLAPAAAHLRRYGSYSVQMHNEIKKRFSISDLEHHKIVIQVGGISPEYGLHLFEESNLTLSDKVIFVLIGPLQEEMRGRLQAMEKQKDNIAYLGRKDFSRFALIDYLSGADIGIAWKRSGSHSLNDRTYTPNKLYDYINAGLKVIVNTTYNGDLPEGACVDKVGDSKDFDSRVLDGRMPTRQLNFAIDPFLETLKLCRDT